MFVLRNWLTSIHPAVVQYERVLIDNGFDDQDLLVELTTEICGKMKIPLGTKHQSELLFVSTRIG